MRAENDIANCPSCGATLIGGLRFCRQCGYRLGEGLDEYVPTQRLDPSTAQPFAPPRPSTDPFAARQTWGGAPMQPMRPFGAPAGGEQQQQGTTSSLWSKTCSKSRGGLWWLWMIIALTIILSVGGAVFKSKFRVGGVRIGGAPVVTNSLMAEADAYVTADGGGAMIVGLAGPGTSLEAAGLVGGDIITSFDGQPVRDAEAQKRLIAATPVGKAVEVIYIHDGETKKTTLTTTGAETFRGMDTLRQRPGGRGVLDVNFDNDDRVRVPNTNIYGVQLDDVSRNGPADIAGLKENDIIITFGGKPIRTAGDLRYRAGAATPGDTVDVVVVRDGQQVTIPVKMGRQK